MKNVDRKNYKKYIKSMYKRSKLIILVNDRFIKY